MEGQHIALVFPRVRRSREIAPRTKPSGIQSHFAAKQGGTLGRTMFGVAVVTEAAGNDGASALLKDNASPPSTAAFGPSRPLARSILRIAGGVG
jgi:hypothetical protein